MAKTILYATRCVFLIIVLVGNWWFMSMREIWRFILWVFRHMRWLFKQRYHSGISLVVCLPVNITFSVSGLEFLGSLWLWVLSKKKYHTRPFMAKLCLVHLLVRCSTEGKWGEWRDREGLSPVGLERSQSQMHVFSPKHLKIFRFACKITQYNVAVIKLSSCLGSV